MSNESNTPTGTWPSAAVEEWRQRAAVAESKMAEMVNTAGDLNRDLTPAEDDLLRNLAAEHRDMSDRVQTMAATHDAATANADAFQRLGLNPAAPTFGDRPTVPALAGVQGREPDLYRPTKERGSSDPSFLRDVLAQASGDGDPDASERLRRHQVHEHQRDATASNFPGFVVPRYTGADAPYEIATGGMPIAMSIGPLPLPHRSEVRYPRETTAPSADMQTAENAASSETDQVTAETVLGVKTISGAQAVSFQAIDLGMGTDDFILESLARQVGTRVDEQILNGTGSNGEVNGLLKASQIHADVTVDHDQASPTAQHIYDNILKMCQKLQLARFDGPDFLIMHPRRLFYLLAAKDDQKRPLWSSMTSSAHNPMGTMAAGFTRYGITGVNLQGIPIVTSGYIGTEIGGSNNEDVVLGINRRDYRLHLSETMTVRGFGDGHASSAASTGVNTLTQQIVMYRYMAAGLLSDHGAGLLTGSVLTPTL